MNKNNKKLGTDFEREFIEVLQGLGFWAHFITPDGRGAQPFDIIAVKNNLPIACDCKTSVKSVFSINRLEDNQILAFEMWRKRGNSMPIVAVKYAKQIYLIRYIDLLEKGRINIEKDTDYVYGVGDLCNIVK